MLALHLLLASVEAGTMTVHMLDVGQGDSLLLEMPTGEHVLIDAGLRGSDVAQTLELLGVDDLDLVFTTHPHADHMGGMRDVVLRFPIELYVDSGMPHTTQTYNQLMEAVHARKLDYQPARRGQVFEYDGVTIEVLWPGETYLTGTRSDLNSNSVVLRVDHGEDCFLFTGDAEIPTEDALVRGGRVQECEVLKVAHHGSHHSSGDSFLRAVEPEIALISCGVGNRYKHPGLETTEALGRMDAVIYRTDMSGHVTLESSGKGVTVVEGLPTDPHLGPVRDERDALAAVGPSAKPPGTLQQRPDFVPKPDRPAEQPTDEPVEPQPAEGPEPMDISGVRPSTGPEPEPVEKPRGLIARIRAWCQRRKAAKENE